MAESDGGNQQPQTLIIKKIDTAPIRPGEPWGSVLLAPGLDGDWVMGEWDGDGWSTLDGWAIAPQYYIELPQIPARAPSLYLAEDRRDQPDWITRGRDL